MSDKPMSVLDVADKAHWEGGVIAAIEYGIRPGDIADEPLRELWREACERFELLEEVVDQIEKILDAAYTEPAGEQP